MKFNIKICQDSNELYAQEVEGSGFCIGVIPKHELALHNRGRKRYDLISLDDETLRVLHKAIEEYFNKSKVCLHTMVRLKNDREVCAFCEEVLE